MTGSLGATVGHKLETVGWGCQDDKSEPHKHCSDVQSYQTSRELPTFVFILC